MWGHYALGLPTCERPNHWHILLYLEHWRDGELISRAKECLLTNYVMSWSGSGRRNFKPVPLALPLQSMTGPLLDTPVAAPAAAARSSGGTDFYGEMESDEEEQVAAYYADAQWRAAARAATAEAAPTRGDEGEAPLSAQQLPEERTPDRSPARSEPDPTPAETVFTPRGETPSPPPAGPALAPSPLLFRPLRSPNGQHLGLHVHGQYEVFVNGNHEDLAAVTAEY